MPANIPSSAAYSRGRDMEFDDQLLHGRHVEDARVGGRARATRCRRSARTQAVDAGAVRAHSEIRPEDREEHRIGARPLAEIDEHLRLRSLIEAELPDVVDDADDLPGRPASRPA